VAELDEKLRELAGEELLFVGLSCIAEGAEWGALSLFLSGGRAYIHVVE
jgi:hypothetical protein